jgi:hypothetical protein
MIMAPTLDSVDKGPRLQPPRFAGHKDSAHEES